MPPTIASLVFVLVVVALFWLDRNRTPRPSGALWVAVVWFLLAASRSLGQWLYGMSPEYLTGQMEASDQLLEGNPFDRAVYMILVILGMIVLLTRRKEVEALLRANGPVILFFLFCAISILWSDFPDVAFKRWIKAVGDLVMVLVILTDREPIAAFDRLLARMTFFLVPLSILLIKYYPNLGRGYDRWDGKAYYTGVALNKNTLGSICLLCGLGIVWRFIMTYQNKQGIARTRGLVGDTIVLLMIVWLFSKANSMTSLTCFMVGTALLLAGNARAVMRKPALLQLLAAVMLSITICVLFLNLGAGVLELMGRNPTLTDRTDVWALLLSVSANPMVGAGYESFWLGPRLDKIWNVYQWRPLEAHNGYLEIFLNLGWIGILLLIIVLATEYRKIITAFRRNPPIGSAMVAYFVIGLIYNITEAAYFRMMTPVWMFLLLAMTGAHVLANQSIVTRAGNLNSRSAPVPMVGRSITTYRTY